MTNGRLLSRAQFRTGFVDLRDLNRGTTTSVRGFYRENFEKSEVTVEVKDKVHTLKPELRRKKFGSDEYVDDEVPDAIQAEVDIEAVDMQEEYENSDKISVDFSGGTMVVDRSIFEFYREALEADNLEIERRFGDLKKLSKTKRVDYYHSLTGILYYFVNGKLYKLPCSARKFFHEGRLRSVKLTNSYPSQLNSQVIQGMILDRVLELGVNCSFEAVYDEVLSKIPLTTEGILRRNTTSFVEYDFQSYFPGYYHDPDDDELDTNSLRFSAPISKQFNLMTGHGSAAGESWNKERGAVTKNHSPVDWKPVCCGFLESISVSFGYKVIVSDVHYEFVDGQYGYAYTRLRHFFPKFTTKKVLPLNMGNILFDIEQPNELTIAQPVELFDTYTFCGMFLDLFCFSPSSIGGTGPQETFVENYFKVGRDTPCIDRIAAVILGYAIDVSVFPIFPVSGNSSFSGCDRRTNIHKISIFNWPF